MRIEQIYIDGYGVFREFTLNELSPALTVIVGPNESGKTTLLSFIRTILFGFLDRRNLYEPLRGGRHGGRLFLVDSRNERLIVERFAGPRGGLVTLTLPDGSEGSANDLTSLLGHASRDVFRNVFAFSLAELQTLETLTSEDIRTRIYGAGIGVGRLGLPEIEKRIKQGREKLFREGGSKQDIAVLIAKAKLMRERLRELSGEVPMYDRLRSDLERLNREIEEKREERERKVAEVGHIKNLLNAWEDWLELQSAKDELTQLPEVTEFPPEGVTRLERLLERHRAREEELEELRRQIAGYQQELDSIQVNDQVLAQRTDIDGLQRGLDKCESARGDLPRRESELKAALDDLQEGLRNLGPGWDEERVRVFDTSLPVRESVRGHGERLEASGEQLQGAERDALNAKGTLADDSAEHERLDNAWRALEEPPERNRKTLEEKRRELRELRSLLSTYRTNLQRRDHLEERKGDLQVRRTSLERQLSQEALFLPSWPAVFGFLVALGVSVWLALQRDWIAAAVMALIELTIGIGYFRIRSKLDLRAQKDILQAELGTLDAQLREIGEATMVVDSGTKKQEDSIRRLAQKLGFESIPDESDIDGTDSGVEEALKALGRWETAQQQVQKAAERVKEQDRRVQEAEEKESRARERAQHTIEGWCTWLQKHGLDATMRPDTCLELLSRVESLREKIKTVDNLRKRIGDIASAVKEYEERANTIRTACNLPERTQSAFPGAVDELVEILGAAREDAKRHQELRQAIEDTQGKMEILELRAQEVETEIKGLLSEGDATDVEDFRKRAHIFGERQELVATIRGSTKNLERIAGRGKALDAFVGELQRTNPEELQHMERELDEQVKKLEKDLDEAFEGTGRVDQQIRGLETEEESSDLRLHLSILQEQLRSKAREWSALTIAQALLAETRLKYERERQPAVVQEAQRFFSSFTDGRYPRILSLPGENRIEVEERTGARKDTSRLSRGTAEQLYLALRFGFVREFAGRSEPLPVIMDEILVNFDPHRARQTCRALGELSKDQQVLVFTCHPETAELLKSETSSCKIIELPPEPA